MAWFKHKSTQEPELPDNHYDFAKMVKAARETDPGKFKKLQGLFKNNRVSSNQKTKSKRFARCQGVLFIYLRA